MNKSLALKTLVFSVVISFFLNIFFSRYLTAQISTLPFLNRLKILSPQAPIVINKREEVRVSDSGDVLAAALTIKSKISSLVYVEKNQVVFLGSVLNLTSDGFFVTSISVLPKVEPSQYFLKTAEGQVVPVAKVVKDPVMGLVFFKSNVNNISPTPLGNSGELKAGEKLALVISGLGSNYQIDSRLVSKNQADVFGQDFFSDLVSRCFQINSEENLINGQILVNLKGEAVGVYAKGGSLSSDVIRQSFSAYLKNKEQVLHPKYGFSYRVISPTENSLLKVPVGFLVKTVTGANSLSLKPGDIITEISGQNVASSSATLEEILHSHSIGETVQLKVNRSGSILDLQIVAGS